MKIFPPQIWRLKEELYSIVFGKCEDCGETMYPYRPVCRKCGSMRVTKVKSKGYGTLISYTISYQHREGYEKLSPMIVGSVLLDEGIEIVAPISADPEEVRKGMRLQAALRKYYVDSSNGLIVYGIKFRPADQD
jgi:uncharacterized OB-fold protein